MPSIDAMARLARLLSETRTVLSVPTDVLLASPTLNLPARARAIASALEELQAGPAAADVTRLAQLLEGTTQRGQAIEGLRRVVHAGSFEASYAGGPIPYRRFGGVELIARPVEGVPDRRVLVLHGGGDAPGMNAALEGFVREMQQLGWATWGILNGWAGLTDPEGQFVPLDAGMIEGIRTLAGTILGTGRRGRSPMDQIDGVPDPLANALGHLAKFEGGLVVMGGNGSGLVSEWLSVEQKARVVFVPATIDGDMPHMKSIGFDSATAKGAEDLASLKTTAASCGKVMVVEIMGGGSGALPLQVAVAGNADFAIIPEVPLQLDRDLYPRIHRVLATNRDFAIVVGEAADWIDGAGQRFSERVSKGTRPSARQIGLLLAETITRETGHPAQHNAPLHVLRGARPVPSDITGGLVAGIAAAQAVSQGRYGIVIPPELVPQNGRQFSLEGFFTNPATSVYFRRFLAFYWRRFFG